MRRKKKTAKSFGQIERPEKRILKKLARSLTKKKPGNGVLSCTAYKPSASKPRPMGMGNRFNEVPLREPRYKPF